MINFRKSLMKLNCNPPAKDINISNMVYLSVGKSGNEYLTKCFPWGCQHGYPSVVLPKGSIKKILGRELTCDDEPIEIDENSVSIGHKFV